MGLIETLFPYNGIIDSSLYIKNKMHGSNNTLLLPSSSHNSGNSNTNSGIEVLIPNQYYDADYIAEQISAKVNKEDDPNNDKEIYKADLALLIVKLFAITFFLRRQVEKIEEKRSLLTNLLFQLQQNPIEYVQSPTYYQYFFINKVCTNFIVAYLNGNTKELQRITRAGEKKKKLRSKSLETIFSEEYFKLSEKDRQNVNLLVLNILHYCKLVSSLIGKRYINIFIKNETTSVPSYYCNDHCETGLLNIPYFVRNVIRSTENNAIIIDEKQPIYARHFEKTNLSMRLSKVCIAFEAAYNTFGKNFFIKDKRVPKKPDTEYSITSLNSSALYDMLQPRNLQNKTNEIKIAFYIDFLEYYTHLMSFYIGKIVGLRILNYLKITNERQDNGTSVEVNDKNIAEAEKRLKILKINLAFQSHLLPSLGIDITNRYKEIKRESSGTTIQFGNKKNSLLQQPLFEEDEDAYNMVCELIVTTPETIKSPISIDKYPLSFQLIFFYESSIFETVDNKGVSTFNIDFSSDDFNGKLKSFTTQLLSLFLKKCVTFSKANQDILTYEFLDFLKKTKDKLSRFDIMISMAIETIIREQGKISKADLIENLNKKDSYNSRIRIIASILLSIIITFKTKYGFDNEFCNPTIHDTDVLKSRLEAILKRKYSLLINNNFLGSGTK